MVTLVTGRYRQVKVLGSVHTCPSIHYWPISIRGIGFDKRSSSSGTPKNGAMKFSGEPR